MTHTAVTPRAPACSPARTTQRKINWDVIRIVAVFAVVAQHATYAGRINHPELGPSPFAFRLQLGASALVVISAFFACATLAKGRPKEFLRSRLARLIPPYLVAVVITYLVATRLGPPGWSSLGVRDLAFNLLMLQNWVPGVLFVDYSYWTLPVQVAGFLAAAALFVGRFGSGRGLRAVLWLLPAAPLVLRLAVDELPWLRTVYLGLALHRAHLFAIGVALWLWSMRRLAGWQAAALGTAGLYAQYVHTADRNSTIGVGVLLAAMAAAASGPDWNGRLVRPFAGAVRWLAGISYGVYLLNQEIGYLLMYRVHQLGGTALPQIAVAFATAVLFGWLLTRLVEQPAHRALMRDNRLTRALGWLVRGRQAHGGSAGSEPDSPAPALRPVSQASRSGPLPRTSDVPLPALLLTSQLR